MRMISEIVLTNQRRWTELTCKIRQFFIMLIHKQKDTYEQL